MAKQDMYMMMAAGSLAFSLGSAAYAAYTLMYPRRRYNEQVRLHADETARERHSVRH